MKSVLISIKPKYCELIASGKKTIEVRKTRPKLETPFKCYIYCTKEFYRKGDGYFQGKYCGKVIGEFICDYIEKYESVESPIKGYVEYQVTLQKLCEEMRLSINEFCSYGNGKPLYGWHISDLKIYDKPKDLSEFAKPCNHNCFARCHHYRGKEYECEKPIITRPPQSWCYVEGVKE